MAEGGRPYCLTRDACEARKPTTHCRRCSISRTQLDPAINARRIQGVRDHLSVPANRAAHAKRVSDGRRLKAANDPGFAEQMREHGRRQQREVLSRPDVRAKALSPEARAKAGRATSEQRLNWCPQHKRAEYLRLLRFKHIPKDEARAMIEADLRRETPEAEARRVIDRITQEMHDKRAREKAQAY